MARKIVKTVGIILAFLILSVIATKLYLKFIYYPNNPQTYSIFQSKVDVDENLVDVEPPVGGCFDICWGKEQLNKCQNYSKRWNKCEISCYGYVYNNCSSSKLGIIVGLISK